MTRDWELQLAFHKGKRFGKRGWFVGFVTKLFTKGRFSHVELVFPKEIAGNENSFSSRGFGSKRQGRKPGVSFQSIQYSNPNRWEWLTLPIVSRGEIYGIYTIACTLKDRKYDYTTVIGRYGLKNKKVNDQDRWYCSEVIAYVLGYRPYNIPPIQLYNLIRRGP